MTEYPKLRPLNLRWTQYEGKEVLVLQDPLRMTENSLVVPSLLTPFLGLLDGLRDNVIGQALKQLDSAALSPNAALLFWSQVYGIENLRKRLLKVVRTGAAAGERVAPQMEIKDG